MVRQFAENEVDPQVTQSHSFFPVSVGHLIICCQALEHDRTETFNVDLFRKVCEQRCFRVEQRAKPGFTNCTTVVKAAIWMWPFMHSETRID